MAGFGFVLVLVLIFLLSGGGGGGVEGGITKLRAIYGFGDSLTDTGNNQAGSNQPPYGQTFFHFPTGRYSDGRIVIDFIAEALGLPFLISSNNGGTNFAIAGTTALDQEVFAKEGSMSPAPITIRGEIQEFLNKKLNACDGCIENSLFYFGEIGGNDFAYLHRSGHSLEEIESVFLPMIMDTVKVSLETLINNGARYMTIQGNFPQGCVPLYASQSTKDHDKNGCSVSWNSLAKAQNSQLLGIVKNLQVSHPNVEMIYFDTFGAYMHIINNARNYGFYVPPTIPCLIFWYACPDPSTHINWDGIHMTEALHKAISSLFLNGNFSQPPTNFLNKK